jgi:hypothetical protein
MQHAHDITRTPGKRERDWPTPFFASFWIPTPFCAGSHPQVRPQPASCVRLRIDWLFPSSASHCWTNTAVCCWTQSFPSGFPASNQSWFEVVLYRLRFISDFVRYPGTHFEYSRDRRDEKLIELAIELAASHIITADNDLLSLQSARNDSGRRFRQRLPHTQVLPASEFLKRHGENLQRGTS